MFLCFCVDVVGSVATYLVCALLVRKCRCLRMCVPFCTVSAAPFGRQKHARMPFHVLPLPAWPRVLIVYVLVFPDQDLAPRSAAARTPAAKSRVAQSQAAKSQAAKSQAARIEAAGIEAAGIGADAVATDEAAIEEAVVATAVAAETITGAIVTATVTADMAATATAVIVVGTGTGIGDGAVAEAPVQAVAAVAATTKVLRSPDLLRLVLLPPRQAPCFGNQQMELLTRHWQRLPPTSRSSSVSGPLLDCHSARATPSRTKSSANCTWATCSRATSAI